MEKKQPEIKKDTEFIGWATFNWGICHNHVYRTGKQAIRSLTHTDGVQYYEWAELKSHMKIVKVKCIVL